MLDNLRGTAACRGEAWAESVARRCRRDQPWPRTPRAAAIARRKVEDLARDERLIELLAVELARWAERRWTTYSSGFVDDLSPARFSTPVSDGQT